MADASGGTAAARTSQEGIPSGELVLEWSKGYRLEHWTRVISILLLIGTGFYIHGPISSSSDGGSMMSSLRFIHFTAAYVLVIGLLIRIYMAFNSKFDADWRDFGLLRNLKRIPQELKYYLFFSSTPPEFRKYNPLQALFYVVWALLIIIQALIGFAIYSGKAFGIWDSASLIWVLNLLGGESSARNIHFLIMWFFVATIPVHIYASVINTYWKKDDTMKSMVTGYKKKTTS